MNSTGNQQRPSHFFEAILKENGLEIPDGRMLFKYAISPKLLDEIRLVLMPGTYGAGCVQRGDRNACALWVFLLSSAWSEHYFDGPWSWDLTLRQAGLSGFEGDYKAFTVVGLNQWKLSNDEYRGEYQKAVVRHAGLPRKRVIERDGYLYSLVRRVVLDNCDRGFLGEEIALEQIRRVAVVINLPRSFRKEAFLRSLAELCSVIHRAIVKADNMQAIDAIRALYPQFRQNEIDCLLQLQKQIVDAAREQARRKPFRLRILRLLEVCNDRAMPLIMVETGRTCQTSSVASLLPSGEVLRNHYMIVAHNGFSRVVLADLRRVNSEDWDIRQHVRHLPRDWFAGPIHVVIERDGAEIAALNIFSLEQPDSSMDLVFSLYERKEKDSASFILEPGTPNAIDTEEFIIGMDSISQWKTHPLENDLTANGVEAAESEAIDDAQPRELHAMDSFLPDMRYIRFQGCLVEVSSNSGSPRYYFSSGDRHERYRFVGKSCWTAPDHAVTQGVPRLYRLDDGGALERFDPFSQPRLEVFWTPLGQKSVPLVRWDEREIYGPGHMEIFSTVSLPKNFQEQGKLKSRVLRQPFTIIPSTSGVRKTEVDGMSSIHLVKWPIDDIDMLSEGRRQVPELNCLDLNEDEDTYVVFNEGHELLDEYSFNLTWSNNAVSQERFSAPVDRCEIKVGNHPARLLKANEICQVDLEEFVYTSFSVRTPRTGDSVRLVLCGIDEAGQGTFRPLWHFRHREVIRKDSFHLTIRLISLADKIRQQFLLCKSRNPKVRFEIQTSGGTNGQGNYQTVVCCEIIQSRVDGHVDWEKGNFWFKRHNVDDSERQADGNTCRAMAINLARPEDVPVEIGTLNFGSLHNLAAQLDPAGIWFIHPAKDSENSFAPALYAGAVARAMNLADFTHDAYQRAILSADPGVRASLFDDYLIGLENRMHGGDPRRLDCWNALVHQCEQLDHIESSYFDLFNALARRPALLALLLVLEKDKLSKFSESVHSSLKFSWLLMGLKDWLLFMECFCFALKADLAPCLGMKSLVLDVLHKEREEVRQLLWNLPFSNNFFTALVDLMFDRYFFPGEMFDPESRQTLRILRTRPEFVLNLHSSQTTATVGEGIDDDSNLSELAALEVVKNSMPCTTHDMKTGTTLADDKAQLACPALFYDQATFSVRSFDHRLFFRLLASQSMLPDQKTWRRWIEANFGLIQYSFHRHSADAAQIFDECLLIQLSHHYHDLDNKGNQS